MKIGAIPGGKSDLAVVVVFFRAVGAASHSIGLTNPVNAAAFGYGPARLDYPGARGDAVTGIDLAGHVAGAVGERQTPHNQA